MRHRGIISDVEATVSGAARYRTEQTQCHRVIIETKRSNYPSITHQPIIDPAILKRLHCCQTRWRVFRYVAKFMLLFFLFYTLRCPPRQLLTLLDSPAFCQICDETAV